MTVRDYYRMWIKTVQRYPSFMFWCHGNATSHLVHPLPMPLKALVPGSWTHENEVAEVWTWKCGLQLAGRLIPTRDTRHTFFWGLHFNKRILWTFTVSQYARLKTWQAHLQYGRHNIDHSSHKSARQTHTLRRWVFSWNRQSSLFAFENWHHDRFYSQAYWGVRESCVCGLAVKSFNLWWRK